MNFFAVVDPACKSQLVLVGILNSIVALLNSRKSIVDGYKRYLVQYNQRDECSCEENAKAIEL